MLFLFCGWSLNMLIHKYALCSKENKSQRCIKKVTHLKQARWLLMLIGANKTENFKTVGKYDMPSTCCLDLYWESSPHFDAKTNTDIYACCFPCVVLLWKGGNSTRARGQYLFSLWSRPFYSVRSAGAILRKVVMANVAPNCSHKWLWDIHNTFKSVSTWFKRSLWMLYEQH